MMPRATLDRTLVTLQQGGGALESLGGAMSHNQARVLEQHRRLFRAPIPRAGNLGVCSVSQGDQGGLDKLSLSPALMILAYLDPS